MLEFCLKMIYAFKKERYNDMNEFLQNLKESIIKGYEDAVLYSEQHSKQRFLDMLIKIEFELAKKTEELQSDAKSKNKRSYDKIEDITRDKMYLVAFCFSYYEHTSLYPKLSQKNALETAAKTLGVKVSTFKNTRDLFDGHNNNHRKGWNNSPMPPLVLEAKEKFENLSRNEVIKMALKALQLSN